MAAEVDARMLIECTGLGSGVYTFGERWTDTNTPDSIRKVEKVLSTTATLLSAIVDVPSSAIRVLAIKARSGNVYVNTISTNISTAGQYVSSGQCIYMSFVASNSCKIAVKGDDADTAMTALVVADVE